MSSDALLPDAAATDAAWGQGKDAEKTLPGLICSLDARNTFVVKEVVMPLLQILPASGGTGASVGIICAERTETSITAVVKGRNAHKKDNALMQLLGQIKTHAPGSRQTLTGSQLAESLGAYLEKQRTAYEERAAERKAAAEATAADVGTEAGDIDAGTEMGDVVPAEYVMRTVSYPLQRADCLRVWAEAQDSGHAASLAKEIVSGAPSEELVSKTNLLSTLSVTARGCAVHDKVEPLAKIGVDVDVCDAPPRPGSSLLHLCCLPLLTISHLFAVYTLVLQDLVSNLRLIFPKPSPKPPAPCPTGSAKDTDAPKSSLPGIVQVLWFTNMFTTEEDWPAAWHNTLSKEQLELRKTDKAAVPRGAGVAEFMRLATDELARKECVRAALEIYDMRADLFDPLFPGVDVKSAEAITSYMTDALCRLQPLSVAQMHELVTSVGTAISRAMDTHKHSGHVEDLPVEVSIPKSLPAAELAVLVWVTYLASTHDNGLDGVIYKNFSKFGRDGAGGTSETDIERGANGNRAGGMSASDRKFHQDQTQKLLDAQPSKQKIESAFDAIATMATGGGGGHESQSEAQFLQEQEQAIIGQRDEATLTVDEKALVGEIRAERVAAVRKAIEDRKRMRTE